MKIIVTGSRSITDISLVDEVIATAKVSPKFKEKKFTEVVSGGAKGVDTIAIQLAHFYNVPYIVFEADWDKYGRQAGFIRNVQMAEYADGLIAVWDFKSKGTQHMIGCMLYLHKPVYIHGEDTYGIT